MASASTRARYASFNGSVEPSDIPTSGVHWTRDMVNDWIVEGYELIYEALVDIEAPMVEIEATGTYTASERLVSLQTMLSISYDPLKLMGVFDVTSDTTAFGMPLDFMAYNQFDAMRDPFDAGGTARYGNRAFTYFSPFQADIREARARAGGRSWLLEQIESGRGEHYGRYVLLPLADL